MTWDARDLTTTDPMQPLVMPSTLAPVADVPPRPALPFFEMEGEEFLDRAWSAMAPADRLMAQQQGYVPPGEWERWRQIVTRGIDGVMA